MLTPSLMASCPADLTSLPLLLHLLCLCRTGQEASQAFEDAAEFGAAVMHWGISREALRRFELRRRPRWTHAMQVSLPVVLVGRALMAATQAASTKVQEACRVFSAAAVGSSLKSQSVTGSRREKTTVFELPWLVWIMQVWH